MLVRTLAPNLSLLTSLLPLFIDVYHQGQPLQIIPVPKVPKWILRQGKDIYFSSSHTTRWRLSLQKVLSEAFLVKNLVCDHLIQ